MRKKSLKEKKKNSRRHGDDDIRILTEDDLDARLEKLPDSRDEGRRVKRMSAGRQKKRKKQDNREFARITYAFVGLFLVLMGYLVYFNIVKSRSIINSPYNRRQDIFADRVVRGKILDKDGRVLAQTKVRKDGTEQRVYPYGDLFAHVVGYSTKGKAGLESVENFSLLTSNAFILEKMVKEFKGEKNTGDNIVTTLDTKLQQEAYNALGKNRGAVVVMEASTGKIRALVSKPAFDPNNLAENWTALSEDADSALLNRAMQGKYAPGSTFKLVTALEFMRENHAYSSYSYKCTGKIERDGAVIHCNNRSVHGTEDLKTSIANSCNTSFSNIGLQLRISGYRKTAKDLLFNTELPSPLMYSPGKFVLSAKDPASEVMMTAIGQGKTQVSPYHMALITAAAANGGKLMKPYLVDQIVNYTGTVVTKNMPEQYAELMTSREAAQLTEYMEAVVKEGTAKTLNGQRYTAAGKTGTAEYSVDKKKAHSWFVGFTNVENPDLVISVVVEGADETGTKAVNVAKKVFNSYY